jgi:hypothetical protein
LCSFRIFISPTLGVTVKKETLINQEKKFPFLI